MHAIILANLILCVYSFIPLKPVRQPAQLTAANSHWACVYILADLEDQNESICEPDDDYSYDPSVIKSVNVRYCSDEERRAGICHARFSCSVLKNHNNCSKDQLNQAIAGEFQLQCGNEQMGQENTRVWINPRLEHDPLKAVAHCVYKDDWYQMTRTRWMETDVRQQEVQDVTATAMNLVAERVGPDVMRCIDHFYWNGS